MTVKEIQERVIKAQEKVEKCKKTIERHKKQADKKAQQVVKKGWCLDKSKYVGDNWNPDALWEIGEYELKLKDIETAERKLADAERILENWKQKEEAETAKQKTYVFELPDFMKRLKEELAEQWTEYDIKARDKMMEEYRTLSYKEFYKKHTCNEFESKRKSDEDLRKINEKDAEGWVLNLYNRVKDVTGEVTDWSGIHFSGKALNGTVIGKEGKARVETVLAGGYNIQRLHMRVLVHKF